MSACAAAHAVHTISEIAQTGRVVVQTKCLGAVWLSVHDVADTQFGTSMCRFTNITRDFKGTLDYILYTADSLAPGALLELPEEAEVNGRGTYAFIRTVLAYSCAPAEVCALGACGAMLPMH